MYCKSKEEFEKNEIPNTKDATIQVLSPKQEKDFIVRRVHIKAGGMMPNHTNEIQHQQVVLKGEAKVVVGDKTYHAKEGDFIYIPADIAHYYEASFGKDYEFLCMITTKEDNIKLID